MNEKICCGLGKKLEYANNQYLCASNCNWGDNGLFYCRKKHCNQLSQVVKSGPKTFNIDHNSKISLVNNCCIGSNPSGLCVTDP